MMHCKDYNFTSDFFFFGPKLPNFNLTMHGSTLDKFKLKNNVKTKLKIPLSYKNSSKTWKDKGRLRKSHVLEEKKKT